MKTRTTLSLLLVALALGACGDKPSDATVTEPWRVHGKVIEFTPSPYD